jgi:ketosteroid isomerase-like protein
MRWLTAVAGMLGKLTIVWDRRQTQDIAIAGGHAFHRYTAVMRSTPKAGGDASETTRRYLDIFRQDASGRWRLAQHIFIAEAAK